MTPRRVPDVLLERYRLGELPPPLRDEVAGALAADPLLRDRLAAIEASDREILAKHPPRTTVATMQWRALAWSRPRKAGMVLVPALLAVWVVVRPVDGPATGEEAAEERAKGPATPGLEAHRRAAGGAERLEEGAVVRSGDEIQLAIRPQGARYAVVVSLDGAGAVTLHLPQRPGPAATLDGPAPLALPHAYRLDDAPSFERFLLVTSEGPFDTREVLAAAERLAADPDRATTAPLELPRGLAQQALLLGKQP